jgi:hypothetical protein
LNKVGKHLLTLEASRAQEAEKTPFCLNKAVDAGALGWNDQRQDKDISSSCRVTGVSSLNLALPPLVVGPFFC